MNFEKFLQKFSSISGVKTFSIIEDIKNPQIYSEKDNDLLEENQIKELLESLHEQVLNLSINSFKMETVDSIFLCIIESDIALLLVLEKDIDLTKLKPPIDQFLNELLIST